MKSKYLLYVTCVFLWDNYITCCIWTHRYPICKIELMICLVMVQFDNSKTYHDESPSEGHEDINLYKQVVDLNIYLPSTQWSFLIIRPKENHVIELCLIPFAFWQKICKSNQNGCCMLSRKLVSFQITLIHF